MAVAQVQHRHQRARRSDDQTPVLARNEVLDTVFGLVGVGDYYYVAGVCRNWRGRYLTLCEQTTQKKHLKFNTSRKNIVMTAARLQLALDDGGTIEQLAKSEWNLADAIVNKSVEPIAVLSLARVYGLQWGESLTQTAAWDEKFELLKWLIKCPLDLETILDEDICDPVKLDHFKKLRALALGLSSK
eukprot:2561-Heterococcus_DN1.PRE.2